MAGVWNATQFAADQEVYFTIVTLSPDPDQQMILALRNAATGNLDNAYGAAFTRVPAANDTVALLKNVAGVATVLSIIDLGGEMVNGDQIGFRVQGSTLSVWHNGRLIGELTDTTYAGAGYVGLLLADTTLDDFGGGAAPVVESVLRRRSEAADSNRPRLPESDSLPTRTPQCPNEVAGVS